MASSVLTTAKIKFAQKKYHEVIALLEPCVLDYHESFSFHLYLGLACLHEGVITGAVSYLDRADQISANNPDPDLLCAQAAIALKRRDTNKAVECYLDALDISPHHKLAKKGLHFLKHHNTPDELGDFLQSGRIKKFYPRPNEDAYKKKTGTMVALCLILLVATGIVGKQTVSQLKKKPQNGLRADLSELVLAPDEQDTAVQGDGNFTYTMNKAQVLETYQKAMQLFQSFHDNLAQVEINRLLNSNASESIKRKARTLMTYFIPPRFDTIKNAVSYAEAKANPALYLNCWVVWTGLTTNIKQGEKSMSFNLLVGYEKQTGLEGVVPIFCGFSLPIDSEKPIKVLGIIRRKDNVLYLKASSIFQSQQPLNSP